MRADEDQRSALLGWLDGWSRCLAEFNYQRTGYRTDGLLDVHLVTDVDIANRTSFAVKIGAVTDAAAELEVSRPGSDGNEHAGGGVGAGGVEAD